MSSIAANSLRTYIFRIATSFVGFTIGVLIARFLGPAGKGFYSGVFLNYGILIQVFGSFASTVVYHITKKRQDPQTVFITANSCSVMLGLLIFGFLLVYHFWNPAKVTWPILLVFSLLPLTLIMANLNGVFQGLNRIASLNWIGIAQGLFQLLLLCIGFFGFRMQVENAIVIWFVSQLAAIAVAFWLGREFWKPPVRDKIEWPLLVSMLGFGWQISLISIVGILNSRIDSLMVFGYSKTAQYGLYSVAVNAAEILWYASSAIAVAICSRVGFAEREQAVSLTARAVRHTLIINIPLALLLWSAAGLIPLIYTNRFVAAVTPFRILIPGVLAYSIAGIFYSFFSNQLGKPKYTLFVSATALVVDGLCCLIMIPRFGLAGAAWSNTISYLVSIGLLIGIFCRETRLSVGRLLKITADDIADYKLLIANIRTFVMHKTGR